MLDSDLVCCYEVPDILKDCNAFRMSGTTCAEWHSVTSQKVCMIRCILLLHSSRSSPYTFLSTLFFFERCTEALCQIPDIFVISVEVMYLFFCG